MKMCERAWEKSEFDILQGNYNFALGFTIYVLEYF